LTAIEFKVTLPEWAEQECKRLKSAQLEGLLLVYGVEKLTVAEFQAFPRKRDPAKTIA